MEIKKILWPTDLSRAASSAESFVISLSGTYGAEVHLLHVAEDLAHFDNYWGSGPDPRHARELTDFAMRASREKLEEICASRLQACPAYRIHIGLGDPAREILKAVSELNIDLVIISTYGLRAAFPFGSVAEKVIKNCPVPVLVVRPGMETDSGA